MAYNQIFVYWKAHQIKDYPTLLEGASSSITNPQAAIKLKGVQLMDSYLSSKKGTSPQIAIYACLTLTSAYHGHQRFFKDKKMLTSQVDSKACIPVDYINPSNHFV